MSYLEQALGDESALPGPQGMRLDRAALDLATIEFPGLDPAPWLSKMDALASRLGDRIRNFNDGRCFVEAARDYLFGELGFHGNEEDYFNPRNSCLNEVLAQRTGIPISLSVFYMEISRRLAMPVFGVNLPRHFILQYDDGNYSAYIDPFHGGRIISAAECYRIAGAPIPDPVLLRRASKRQIIVRMLVNLHGIYMRAQDWERSVRVLDLLIVAGAGSELYKQRGLLYRKLGRFHAARLDLERYLALEPAAADREDIVKQLEAIHRARARLN